MIDQVRADKRYITCVLRQEQLVRFSEDVRDTEAQPPLARKQPLPWPGILAAVDTPGAILVDLYPDLLEWGFYFISRLILLKKKVFLSFIITI
jgi:hypothetical protein